VEENEETKDIKCVLNLTQSHKKI